MKTLYKELLVSIFRTKKRFISILLIVLLGVGFFGGIKITSPNMKDTLDIYYNDTNFMDINIKSSWGIEEEDINLLEENGYIVEAGYSIDAIVEDDIELVSKILSYNSSSKINEVELTSGVMPTKNNHCVVDDMSSFEIGDKIKVNDSNLKVKELEVVGKVRSPLYSSIEKGSTNLLNGQVSLFMYVLEDTFDIDYYTDMYIDLDINNHTFSNKYWDIVDKEVLLLEDIFDKRSEDRYSKVNISSLEKPIYYILDRESNVGYYQFNQDVDRINNVSKVFPIVFFVVAILICLTTMTRMVEEERTQLGTLKSLGYTNIQIMSKYIIYSTVATIIGASIGVFIGYNVIPTVIFNMYKFMYNIGDISLGFSVYYYVLGLVIALVCTIGATLLTCYKELKTSPAQLMRPKSPKAGKKVFLEYISFIWKRLRFTNKVTVRNVFRYKKRFLMTIFGICGCTGLIIAGFGLRDSIFVMVPNQYEEIFKYQVSVTLDDSLSFDELENIHKIIKSNSKVNDSIRVYEEAIELDNYDTNQTIQLIVPFDDISNFINVRKRGGEDISIKDGVVVSEKLYNLLELDSDSVLEISGKGKYKANVLSDCENYIFHYMYMDKSLLDRDNYNTIFIKTDKMSVEEENIFSKELNKIDGVSSILFLSSRMHTFDDAMSSFGLVALVLIVSAGLLAFVVLYNLATVNIGERKRELATIKVLGFYDNEVYNYVGRETVILSIIGIFLGIGFGFILTEFIIKTCELDMMFFKVYIKLSSYIFSILITIIFTLMVNIMIYFSLKKINMIESLKSIE